MSERVAYDTNVLAYIAGVNRGEDDLAKIEAARSLHEKLGVDCICIAPLQALGELYTLLARYQRDRQFAYDRVALFRQEFEDAAASSEVFTAALDLATDHKLQMWDALILATASHAGCSLLLSEDMQDGCAWRGTTVVNPFVEKPHRALARVLARLD